MWSTQPDVNLGKNGGRVAVASVREYVYVCNKDTGVILKFELNEGVVKEVDSGWDLRSPVGENLYTLLLICNHERSLHLCYSSH